MIYALFQNSWFICLTTDIMLRMDILRMNYFFTFVDLQNNSFITFQLEKWA
jgi:hypothetical protein